MMCGERGADDGRDANAEYIRYRAGVFMLFIVDLSLDFTKSYVITYKYDVVT